MRDILFRGKSKETSEWEYGGMYYYMGFVRIVNYINDNIGNVIDCHHDVDPVTVGQYIGRKDRNNKKIFENDIVKIYGVKGIIRYEADTASYVLTTSCKELLPLPLDTKKIEVIGNIYDNLELLEQCEKK